VIPSGTTNPEYATVQRELNAMFPDLAFTVMGAADDVAATDMVVRGEADLSETNSAGIVAKYDFPACMYLPRTFTLHLV
jgi:hypothetical protein